MTIGDVSSKKDLDGSELLEEMLQEAWDDVHGGALPFGEVSQKRRDWFYGISEYLVPCSCSRMLGEIGKASGECEMGRC